MIDRAQIIKCLMRWVRNTFEVTKLGIEELTRISIEICRTPSHMHCIRSSRSIKFAQPLPFHKRALALINELKKYRGEEALRMKEN